ncbi:MAG: TonB-dependent receptor [Acidobacteria bacterium]|nr:TonB-dependent receptor [Acidobacteriota bacterium]MCW5948671.1 TonB-dependent receptor [Pyrinomonadaceae bacterium]
MTGRPLLFFALILFTFTAISAQTASIRVAVEDQANAPIPGAIVILRNTRTGQERSSVTGLDGVAEFARAGGDRFEVLVTAAGFERGSGQIENNSASIVLKPSTVREEVTVVSGSRQEELRESLSTKVDVLTAADIRSTGYENVGEALREVPGVVTRRGSETSGVAGEQVQGIDSRQVLVLLDGQPVTGARGIKSGAINLDRQSTARLETIEVVKGSASALYGSDAIGGVINLRTREPRSPFSASVTAAAGNFGVFDGRADVGFIKKRLSGLFSIERHKNNGFDLDPATYQAEGAGFHRYDAYGRLKYQFNNRFAVTGFATSYWNTSRGRVLGESGPQTNDVDDQSQSYGLTGDWAIDGRTNLQLRGYFSRYDEVARGLRYPSGIALPDGNLYERYGKFDGTFSRLVGSRNFVQAGFEFVKNRYRGINRLQNDRADAWTRVAWAQDKINLTDRLTLTLGARLDDHSVFGSAVSPKAALNYRLANWASLRASWGRGFRAPDLGQLYYRLTSTANFYQVLGNPGLSPETAGSWQVGGEFSAMKRKARFGVNLFRNDVKNLITSRNLGLVTMGNVNAIFAANGIDPSLRQFITYNLLLFYYQNIANIYTQGAEFDGSYTLPKGFAVSGAYTYLEGYDKATHRYLIGRFRHQGFAKLAYANARLGFNANLRGSLYSRWIATRNETTNAQVYGAAYSLWDVYGAKRLPRGFEVYGTIDNLFNDRDPNRGTSLQQRLEVGRTFRLGVRWSFEGKR